MAGQAEWTFESVDRELAGRLCSTLGCPEPVAACLVNRGLADPDEAARYLRPSLEDLHDPIALPDAKLAVDRMGRALQNGDNIAVFADRDIDGIAGAAIIDRLLAGFDQPVLTKIPGKYDGYGLKVEYIDEIVAADVDVLVTVDAGTTAIDPIDRAGERGIDTIVLDHHSPPDEEPNVAAHVNPRLDRSDYPHDGLAGGGVAFKIGQALFEATGEDAIEEYYKYGLPLAALATVGDYAELTTENRAIVRGGFERLEDCDLPGLINAVGHVGVDSLRDLGWSLIPLLNAGQEHRDGSFMLEVILAEDDARFQEHLDRLERYREQRREDRRERKAHLDDCIERQVDPETDAILLVETERYVGGGSMYDVSGSFGKPVVAYRRKGTGYQGGGRSDQDVDLYALFGACEDLTEDVWGHPGAAGFRVDEANIDAYLRCLDAEFRQRYDPQDLRPTIEVDARLEPTSLERDLVDAIEELRPFGNGNPEPRFLIEDLEVSQRQWFGRNNEHFKLRPTVGSFTAVSWQATGRYEEVDAGARLDLVGTLAWDEYEGLPRVTIEDWRPAAA